MPEKRSLNDTFVFDPITEITFDEVNLIHAYQMSLAWDRLAANSDVPDYRVFEIRNKHPWVETWRPFDGFSEALKHLEQVNAYHLEKYGERYVFAYLIDFDNWYYNRIMSEFDKSGNLPKKKSKLFDSQRGDWD